MVQYKEENMNINAPVNIAEIQVRIYDAFEQGYDDKQQVYEDLEDQYFEGFTKEQQDHFGSFKKFLNAVNFENIAKEMANFHN